MKEIVHQTRKRVQEMHPLIHCITNPISINQCANAVLAVGARPMMAEHPKEVREITRTADALVLNLGNITDARKKSMLRAARVATKGQIPFLVDLVGIACNQKRRRYARRMLKTAKPAIIKGNYSEIKALYDAGYHSDGVDADQSLTAEDLCRLALQLAKHYGAVILASGKVDIVTDGKQVIRIKNGTPQLTTLTGTGCMLGMLCGCYLSVAPSLDAAVTACTVLGIAGELAETQAGSGSFSVELMNHVSTLTEQEVAQNLNMEVDQIETA